jgi:hypothetical protein
MVVMPYSAFTLERAQRTFALDLREHEDLFRDVAEHAISPLLEATLDENIPLAMAINTEKARSELIVAPVLVEVRRLLGHRVSLFSGVEFEVAPESGLNGSCDFILAKAPNQWVLTAPVLVVVEAKNDNLKGGFGQCVATMVAARLFNEREQGEATTVYGAVTTGSLWQFLRLDGSILDIDGREYHIERLAKILGILTWMLTDEGDRARLVA